MAAKKKTTAKVAKARPKKPTAQLRLERGEGGDARVFWEIAQLDKTIKTHAGRYLYPGRVSEKVYADRAKADVAFAQAIAKKREEGYSEPTPKDVIGGSSRKGVVSRNAELEALIDEDPSDLSRYLVYADWLQQQGDPRGELIMAQHKLAVALVESGQGAKQGAKYAEELDALEHIEWKLFRDFKHELLGRLAKYTVSTGSVRNFAWRCGFIRAASVHSMDALDALLDHPTGRFLEHLVVDWSLVPTACALLEQKAPATFSTLSIETGYSAGADLRPIVAVSKIRKVWVTGRVTNVGDSGASMNHIQELDIGFATPETVVLLSKAHWPALERLHLTLAGFDELETSTMTKVLSDLVRQIPTAEHVTLRRWNVGTPQAPLAIAALTAFKNVESKVKRLDLEMAVTRGADELMAIACGLPRTLRLQMPSQAINDPMLRAQFRDKVKTASFVAVDPVERIRNDVAPFHHAASIETQPEH